MQSDASLLIAPPEILEDPLPAAPKPPASPLATTAVDQAEREEAFDDEPVWNGMRLHAFSLERYNIFQSQRLSMNAPPLIRCVRDGAGFFPDAVRILWLCSQEWEQLAAVRRDPELMQDLMERWAADNCPVHLSNDAITLGIRMFNAANVNRHATRPDSNTATGTGKGLFQGN